MPRFAVEIRLGKKSTGQLQDFIGPAQFLDLALQRLYAFVLGLGGASPGAGIDLFTLGPLGERLRNAADLRSNRFDSRPQRGLIAPVLLPHTRCALANLG